MRTIVLVLVIICLIGLIFTENNQDKSKEKSEKDQKKDLDKLKDALKDSVNLIKQANKLAKKDNPDISDCVNMVKGMVDIGAAFIPGLKVVSSVLGELKGVLGGADKEDPVITELKEIKDSIAHLQEVVNMATQDIKEEFIKSDFRKLDLTVDTVQKRYDAWSLSPSKGNRDEFVEQCKLHKMSSVIDNLHTGIVNRGQGYYNQLLEGGPLKEMSETDKWAKAYLALFMQGNFLRSICFTFTRMNDTDFERDFQADIDTRQRYMQEIGKAIESKLADLKQHYWSNANVAMKNFRASFKGDGCTLMKQSYRYLNKNFNPGENGSAWNVAVIDGEQNHVHSDWLVWWWADGKIVFAGYSKKDVFNGPSWSHESGFGWSKDLTMLNIGDKKFNFKYNRKLWLSNGVAYLKIKEHTSSTCSPTTRYCAIRLEQVEYVPDYSCGKP